MAGIYDLMQGIRQQADQGTQRGLAQLVGKAYGAPREQRQQILGTVAQRGAPQMAYNAQAQFDQMDDTARQRLGQYAAAFDALPDQMKAQAYPQFAQQSQELGIPAPAQWDPAFAPNIQKLAQALGGMGGTGGNVQSTYIDAQGNRVAIMRDGSQQVLGPNAPSNQIIDTGNGFFGVNKGNLQAQPVMTGGQPQQQTAPGEVPYSIDPRLPPEVQAAIRANPDAGSAQGIQSLGGGEQLRSVPKPPTQLQVNADARDAERLRLAQEAADRVGQPTAAQRAKMERTAQKDRQLLQANDAQVDQTVKLIDSILDRRGDLAGVTGMGKVGAMIPGTDWADVAAKLDTLKGRSAFGALQQMRANSPTGGALGQVSERELYLLQNAETQLQDSQSPESLAQALRDYKAALLESKRRMREGVSEFYSEQGVEQQPAQGGGWKIEVVQ